MVVKNHMNDPKKPIRKIAFHVEDGILKVSLKLADTNTNNIVKDVESGAIQLFFLPNFFSYS